MRTALAAGVASFLVAGVATHLALLHLAPGWATDHLTFGPSDGRFELSLRLYQAEAGVAAHRGQVPLPTIERLGCGVVAS